MTGEYETYEVYERSGSGTHAFRFTASNGQIVATDGG
jgi:uncharacterized protein YegP (UPF0339 family)